MVIVLALNAGYPGVFPMKLISVQRAALLPMCGQQGDHYRQNPECYHRKFIGEGDMLGKWQFSVTVYDSIG